MTFWSFLNNLSPHSEAKMPRERIEAERERKSWNDLNQLQEALHYYSGYFRQAAVERCEELRLDGSLPYVALCLNDWVPQVRHAARKAVLAMLDSASLGDQLATLEIVDRLHHAGRTDHGEWISEFELKFIAVTGHEVLWEGFVNGPRKLARTCFELLRRHALVPVDRLLRLGVASKGDIVLAARSVGYAAQLPPIDSQAILRLALDSHFGSVRRLALQSLLSHDEAGELASRCLLDKHATVRSLAMNYLGTQGLDLKGFYRQRLHSASSQAEDVRNALLSLALLGSAEDLDAIKDHAGSASVRVRAAAYASWFRLDPAAKDALVLQAFADGAPSMRKFARLLLERHGAYARFGDLYGVLGPCDDLLDLMFTVRSHKWNWLEAIAMIADNATLEPRLAARLAGELRDWISSERWSRHRPIGNQARELCAPASIQRLEALIAGENDLIAQLREQIIRGTSA